MKAYERLKSIVIEKYKDAGILPLFFIVAYVIAVLLVDWIFFDGSRFVGVSWHPFGLLILLITVVYGLGYGMFTTFFCIVSLYVGNFPDIMPDESAREYWLRLTINPAAWIIVVFIIGYIRKRELRVFQNVKSKLDAAERKAEEISRQYNKIVSVNNQLEEKLASQSQTIFTVYDAIKNIETNNLTSVVDGCASLLKMVLNADKFSIFLLHGEELKSVYAYGWDSNESHASEYGNLSHLYTEIVKNNKTLSVLNDDAEILDGALFICPISLNGKVFGMIRVDDISFASMTAQNLAAVKVVAEWTAVSLNNVATYDAAKEQSLIDPEMNVMSSTFYKKELNFVANLAERCAFSLSVITISVDDLKFSVSDRKKLSGVLSEAVCAYLRRTDLIFVAPRQDVAYALMLPGTDQKGAQVVADKITLYLKDKTPYWDKIKCSIQNVYQAEKG